MMKGIRIERMASRKAAELIADFFGTNQIYSTSDRGTYAAADARNRFWIPVKDGKDVIVVPPSDREGSDYIMMDSVIRYIENSR